MSERSGRGGEEARQTTTQRSMEPPPSAGTAALLRLPKEGSERPSRLFDLARGALVSTLAGFFYEHYWRVTVERAERVPFGPAVLVANQSGALPLGGLVLRQALLRERPDLPEPRWLLEDPLLNIPFLGTLLNRLGAVRTCPRSALHLLGEGRAIIVFPEGVRGLSRPPSERQKLQRFGRGGFVKLAMRVRAPLIPVAVMGGEKASPLLAQLPARQLGLPYLPLTTPPLPARWTFRIGEPVPAPRGPAVDQAEVDALVERLRGAIEKLLRAPA